MRFGNDWRNVLKNAWSVRANLLGLVLTVAGVALTGLGVFGESYAAFVVWQVLGALCFFASTLLRLLVQKDVQ